jgi:CMP-N,N'-diacetyllegionaminic acid synthase
MDTLFLIPARGGSKGIPGKNSKLLHGKPLIQYSIETARALGKDLDICLSTDSDEIIAIAKALGLEVPFVRPANLATDTANSRDVILHALSFFQNRGKYYENVVLLQPTSPFRKLADVRNMMDLLTDDLDMVVSVKEAHDNPYYSLFEENENGYLELSKKGNFTRRQDVPKVYAYNGSVYVIKAARLIQKPFSDFDKIVKYEMDNVHSIDIDTPFDWQIAEMIVEKKLSNC